MAKCFIKTFRGNYWEILSVAASNSPTHNPLPPLDFAPQSRLCGDPIIGEGDRDKRWRGVAVGVCLIKTQKIKKSVMSRAPARLLLTNSSI